MSMTVTPTAMCKVFNFLRPLDTNTLENMKGEALVSFGRAVARKDTRERVMMDALILQIDYVLKGRG